MPRTAVARILGVPEAEAKRNEADALDYLSGCFHVSSNCAMCLGYPHRCPKFAIQHDDKTKDHGQYLHPDEKD